MNGIKCRRFNLLMATEFLENKIKNEGAGMR